MSPSANNVSRDFRIESNNVSPCVYESEPLQLVGYMRVSKDDGSQNMDLQKDALLQAGITEYQIYEDLSSGKNTERPGLTHCLKALRSGDTLW